MCRLVHRVWGSAEGPWHQVGPPVRLVEGISESMASSCAPVVAMLVNVVHSKRIHSEEHIHSSK